MQTINWVFNMIRWKLSFLSENENKTLRKVCLGPSGTSRRRRRRNLIAIALLTPSTRVRGPFFKIKFFKTSWPKNLGVAPDFGAINQVFFIFTKNVQDIFWPFFRLFDHFRWKMKNFEILFPAPTAQCWKVRCGLSEQHEVRQVILWLAGA